MDKKFKGLSGNQLKIIAAVSMAADHIGYMIFPDIVLFRIIGRLAFPLFSFFIYQGSRYTRSKAKYLAKLFGLGFVCVLGYYIYCREIYLNSLIAFSLSACILFALQYFKKQFRLKNTGKAAAGAAAVFLSIGAT